MGSEYKGPPVSHRIARRIAVEKGTDARGFVDSPPMEKGAGGSVPTAVAGGKYVESPSTLQSAPLKNPTKSPIKGV